MSASLLLLLIGCANSGDAPAQSHLPPPPADLRPCFEELVDAPAEGALTVAETLRLIAALRHSEVEKSLCGERLLDFYENLRG